MDFAVTHPFLKTYLKYIENTESPRLFHIWCAVSAIGAALGRRCWYDNGIGNIYPNMYIVLCGPPATRKGAAIKFAKSLLEQNTSVRFAPNDTGGHRQGLISAMTDIGDAISGGVDRELLKAFSQGADETEQYSTVGSLMRDGKKDTQALLDSLDNLQIDNRDPRTMYIVASELNSILGENNTQMLTFLQEMWDGVPYRYRLRNSEYEIKDAVLSILGGTTPVQISLALPPEAVGQGFTSRIIFVFADKQHARIPRPSIDAKASGEIGAIFSAVFNRFEGAFTESPEAARKIDEIYMRGAVIKDQRFLHYVDRRGDHLKKVAMALAAGRGDKIIEDIDVVLADQLLSFTEQSMPDALGEYGMNKLGAAKQRLLDMVRSADAEIPMGVLQGLMAKDMNALDFRTAIAELHNSKKISVMSLPGVGQCVIATDETGQRRSKKDLRQIARLMADDDVDEQAFREVN